MGVSSRRWVVGPWVGPLMVGVRLGLCSVGGGDVCLEWGFMGGLDLAGRRRFAVAWGDRLVSVLLWMALVDVVVVVGQVGMSVCCRKGLAGDGGVGRTRG